MAGGPHLGIDFGTSHTVGMIAWRDGRVRPLLFDGSPLMPSAVYAEPAGDKTGGAAGEAGRLIVGRDAVHAARADPARFEAAPKRRIDEGSVLLGDQEYPVTALIAAVLTRVREEATRVTGVPPAEVHLSHPAAWGVSRRLTLLEAAKLAGLGEPSLVPEPVAAARYFAEVLGHRFAADQGLLVYDFGGGTFDASLVMRGPGGYDVRALDGIDDLGGLDFDNVVVEYARESIGTEHSEAWQRLANPGTTEDRRHHRMLWDDARVTKEMLSRAQTASLHVPVASVDLSVTRAAFEERAKPLVEHTVRTTSAVLRWAGLDREHLAGVFLVGGSSRIPLVSVLLERELGTAPVMIEQPELVVAEGTLRTAVGDPTTAGMRTGSGDRRPDPASGDPASGSVSGQIGGPTGIDLTSGSATAASALPGSPVSPGAAGSTGTPVSSPPVTSVPPGPPVPRPAGGPTSLWQVNTVPIPPVVDYPRSPQPPMAGSPGGGYPAGPAWGAAMPPAVPPVRQPVRPPAQQAARRPAGPSPGRSWWPPFLAALFTLAVVAAGFVLLRPYLVNGLGGNAGHSPQPGTTTTLGERPDVPRWLPAGWQVAVRDTAENLWLPGDEREGGRCEVKGDELLVSRPNAGITGCTVRPPLAQNFVDVAAEGSVTVHKGCAGIWVRTGGKGYFLRACDGHATLSKLFPIGSGPASGETELGDWDLDGRPQNMVIGLMVRADELSVYVDGRELGVVHDSEIRWGKVVAGAHSGDDGAAEVVIRDFRVYAPPGTPNTSFPATTASTTPSKAPPTSSRRASTSARPASGTPSHS